MGNLSLVVGINGGRSVYEVEIKAGQPIVIAYQVLVRGPLRVDELFLGAAMVKGFVILRHRPR
jgi:hypothetical protein